MTLAAILLWAGLGIYSHSAPAPLGEDAAPDQFSAARAHKHLLQFATKPHPSGSQQNAIVRDYLVGVIREMGYEPQVFSHHVRERVNKPDYKIAYVDNILVRVPGTANTKALMLMAHYDSVPYGPGASDDGSGVVAMLETLRAMKHLPALKNDVIFFFTDGEEAGLLGPKSFLEHEWADDVGLVLNFEARGYYGPSYMFQTSENNGRIVEEFAKAAPHPIANSFMFDVAGKMPTTTDYEILKRAGYPGMDMAYVGGIKYYHTVNDSPEKISLASIQHHGSYALSLSQHFGTLDLRDMQAPNRVYFNTIGKHIVHYPFSWVMPLSVLVGLVFVAMLALGIRKRFLTVRGILGGVAMLGLSLLITFVCVALLMLIAWWRFQEYLIYNSDLFFWGFVALTLCVFSLVSAQSTRRFGAANAAAGALFWWLPFLVLFTVAYPGGSYLAQWPFLSASLGLLTIFLLPLQASALTRALLLFAAAAPAVMLIVPMIFSGSVAVTIIPAPIWMSLITLVCGLALPLLSLFRAPNEWWFPLTSSAAATPCMLLAFFWFGFTKDHPKMNHLCYGMDSDSGEAVWISGDSDLDSYTSSLMTDARRGSVDAFDPKQQENAFWLATAPAATFPQPEIEIIRDELVDEQRHLEFKLKTPRLPENVYLTVEPGVAVYAAELEKIELGAEKKNGPGDGDEAWTIQYQGLPKDDGLEFSFITGTDAPFHFTVRERSTGVPGPGMDVPQRPDNMITQPNTVQWWRKFRSNAAYTIKRFSI